MTWEEMLERFREALRAEARKRWGRIGAIEQRAGMRRGKISDFYSGRVKELSALLRALDALEIDHSEFFSRALGLPGRPEDYLAELGVGAEESDAKIVRLERATYRLEAETPPPAEERTSSSEVKKQLAVFSSCDRREQRRRLRETSKYRTHAFARAYLRHLETLRYDAPDEAAELASAMILQLIPRLPAPQNDRLDLHCMALGVYGSARRARGRFNVTARILREGIELARRQELRRACAELLQRASYLLMDLGQFERGLVFLSEALVLYTELGSRIDIGKVLVDRGMMIAYQGEYRRSIRVLREALVQLEVGDADVTARNRCAAYQFIAYDFEHLGDLREASHYLRKARSVSRLEAGLHRGRLMWSEGVLAFRTGSHQRAERLLMQARDVLSSSEHPGQETLVSLDLLDVLWDQGKLPEACDLARNMVHLLEVFETNRLASSAIAKLIRPALVGRISKASVSDARRALSALERFKSALRRASH